MSEAVPNPIWREQARQWARLGPPLKPSRVDIARVETIATEWSSRRAGRPLRVVLLGVTPELATLPWPAGTFLTAVDRSEGMIATVWPCEGTPENTRVVCADWCALPLAKASADLVIGDGAVNALQSSALYASFSNELRRVLAPGGLLHLRTFVAPAVRESLSTVVADVAAGRIRSFHALKWRVAMAVPATIARGTNLGDVWDAFRASFPDEAALAAQLGCGLDIVATIHTYRGSAASYTFPTLSELQRAFADRFIERSLFVPDYELGERCPSMLFEVR